MVEGKVSKEMAAQEGIATVEIHRENLYSKLNAHSAVELARFMTLAAFLAQAGFRRIALSRSGVGHFHAVGSLSGHSVAVLIDTGAASTVVSLALARELGLTLKKLEMKGGGAGGTHLDIFHLADATLLLGEVQPRARALLAMDLTHVNQSLALKGEAAIDVILGADVFEAQAAVIDYGSSSLFLKV